MNLESTQYGIKRELEMSYQDTVNRIIETLKEEGFGILTEIDVKATFKKKLDRDFTDYVIFGACAPPLAWQALHQEIDLGLLLPCNVVVYKKPGQDQTVVAAVDPGAMIKITARTDMEEFACTVREKLYRAIEAV